MTDPIEITHMIPPEGGSFMPCCGLTPFEVPKWQDRLTSDPDLVTCSVLEDLALAEMQDAMAEAEADLKAGRTKSLQELRAKLS